MIFRKTAVCLMTVLSFLTCGAYTISADNEDSVQLFDFEGNSAQGWYAFGTGNVSASNEVAFSGEYSLKTTNRGDSWNGPVYNINAFLTAGQQYSVSIHVFNASDTEDAYSATLKTVSSDDNEKYTFVSRTSCPPNQWNTITGEFSFEENLNSALLYIESQSTGDFYIDDVSFEPLLSEDSQENPQNDLIQDPVEQNEVISDDDGLEPENEDTEEQTNKKSDISSKSLKEAISHTTNIARGKQKYNFTFEKNDTYDENFYTFNSGRLIRNKDRASKGSYSLYTSQRETNDSGPSISLDFLQRNTEYTAGIDVLYEGTEYDSTANFCLCLGFFKGDILKQQIISKETVKKTEWTTIKGNFLIPSDASNPFMYIITENTSDSSASSDPVSFYIDEFCLNDLSSSYIQSFIIIFVIIIVVIGSGLLFYFSRHNKNLLSPDKKTILEDIDPETNARTREAYNRDVILMIGNPKKAVGKYISVFDIDSFKSIEKLYGKRKSDQALKRCADMIIETAGDLGTVYRTGNNEFVCISDTDLETQFERTIAIECGKYLGYPFSVAQGYDKYKADKDGDEPDIRNIISRADEKMCINKEKQKKSHSAFE